MTLRPMATLWKVKHKTHHLCIVKADTRKRIKKAKKIFLTHVQDNTIDKNLLKYISPRRTSKSDSFPLTNTKREKAEKYYFKK